MRKFVVGAVLTLLVGIILMSGCHRVDPTEVGFIISNSGDYRGIDSLPTVTGYNYVFPWASKLVTIPTTQQHVVWSADASEGTPTDQAISVACQGGAGFKMDVGFNYRVNPYLASKIYLKYRTDDLDKITSTYLRNVVRGAMQDLSGTMTVDSLLNYLPFFEHTVANNLTERLGKEGFTVDNFNILKQPIPTDANLAASIAAKVKAKQDAETSKMQLQQSIAEANKQIAAARGDSASEVIAAEGKAIANEKLQQSLTPMLIQKMWVEKWKGDVPTYQMGGATPLINIPK